MNYIKTSLLFFCFAGVLSAQETLTKSEAFKQTLANNYGILMAENNTAIAKNNASVYNTGYLPSISTSANAGFTSNNSEFELQSGENKNVNNADAQNYDANINLNYVIFDGFGRSYNFKKLQEAHHLSKLETTAVMENTVIDLFNTYYSISELTENSATITKSFEISEQRLKRANYMYEYGQSTKLEVLNAEVDLNNDRVNLLQIKQQIDNAKREINLIIGRDVNTLFEVEPQVTFPITFKLETLLKEAQLQNVEMQKIRKTLKMADYDLKSAKSNYLPSVRFNGGYHWNNSQNDATFTYNKQTVNGVNAGLNLSWNVFDGGRTKTQVANVKIQTENLKIQEGLLKEQLELYVRNSYNLYQNDLEIITFEKVNVATNQRNFDRTQEQYKLGQVTSIVFRQAQINLLNAQTNLLKANFSAKRAGLILLQLSGKLLESAF